MAEYKVKFKVHVPSQAMFDLFGAFDRDYSSVEIIEADTAKEAISKAREKFKHGMDMEGVEPDEYEFSIADVEKL